MDDGMDMKVENRQAEGFYNVAGSANVSVSAGGV